eukprot:6278809-Pyramimonas_sp.AAC.1
MFELDVNTDTLLHLRLRHPRPCRVPPGIGQTLGVRHAGDADGRAQRADVECGSKGAVVSRSKKISTPMRCRMSVPKTRARSAFSWQWPNGRCSPRQICR